MCAHPRVSKPLDLWVTSFYVLPTKTSVEESEIRLLKRSAPPPWRRQSSTEMRSGSYMIWQSVSQYGALSHVKYLAALPSNCKNGCLASSVEFRPLLGWRRVYPAFPSNKRALSAHLLPLLGLINSTETYSKRMVKNWKYAVLNKRYRGWRDTEGPDSFFRFSVFCKHIKTKEEKYGKIENL